MYLFNKSVFKILPNKLPPQRGIVATSSAETMRCGLTEKYLIAAEIMCFLKKILQTLAVLYHNECKSFWFWTVGRSKRDLTLS